MPGLRRPAIFGAARSPRTTAAAASRTASALLEAHPDLEVVGEAGSGEATLALVSHLHPDVVLMDIRLPGINGIEATRRLTRDHPQVRVLMVSAYDEDEYVRSALEAGAAGYLSKTAPGKALALAVRAAVCGMSVLQSGLTARLLASGAISPAPGAPSRWSATGGHCITAT